VQKAQGVNGPAKPGWYAVPEEKAAQCETLNGTQYVFGKKPFGFRHAPESSQSDRAHPGGLTRDHVIWAYRLLLDRDPESDDVIGPKLAGSRDTRELRHHLMTSAEFRENNPDYAHTNDRTIVIKEIDTAGGRVRLFVDLADHVIGLNIVRGRYEADAIEFVQRVLNRGEVAIDVGAHIGFFAVQMAALVGPGGHIYAFEPLASNADLLERSIGENRFGGRITLKRSAVGERSGTASLTFPAETLNSGGAYVLRDGSAPLPGNLQQSVSLVALDDLELRRPVRVLKMDAEGAEPRVIRGALRLIAEDRPVILSELHPTQLERSSGTTPDDFFRQLQELEYRAQDLRGASIERAPADAIMSAVFVPKEAEA
jgi:FkbM family methyltransferase